MTSAASRSAIRRDAEVRRLAPSATGGTTASDILFAPLGDEAGRTNREHQQQQPEHHDVDQPGIEILRGEALDQADEHAGENRSLDIAEAADDDDRERRHDDRGAGEWRQT